MKSNNHLYAHVGGMNFIPGSINHRAAPRILAGEPIAEIAKNLRCSEKTLKQLASSMQARGAEIPGYKPQRKEARV